MRKLMGVLAVILVAGACSSDADSGIVEPSTSATSAPDSTEPPITTTIAPGPTTTATPSTIADAARPVMEEIVGTDTVLSIAHAGGDLESPHSTMFAFARAWESGATVLELDVQLTADGALVVQHDETVDKTTEATGPVAALSLAELQALDNAYWFSPQCWPCHDRPVEEYLYRGVRTGETAPPAGFGPDDFRVITFRELVERFPEAIFDVEIKGSEEIAPMVAEALAAEVVDLAITQSTIAVSFNDAAVARYRELVPDGWTSPGQDELVAWVLGGVPLVGHRIIQVPPFFDGIEVVNPALIATVRSQNLDIWVWPNDAGTQENSIYYQELIDLGVDGIIAGRPTQVPQS